MKSVIVILMVLLGHAPASASDELKCYDSLDIPDRSVPLEGEGGHLPGYWYARVDEELGGYLHVFVDFKKDRFGLVRSVEVGETEITAHYQSVALCVAGERRFIRDDDGYHEYEIVDENTLRVADDEFDPEDPAEEPSYSFSEYHRARLTVD